VQVVLQGPEFRRNHVHRPEQHRHAHQQSALQQWHKRQVLEEGHLEGGEEEDRCSVIVSERTTENVEKIFSGKSSFGLANY